MNGKLGCPICNYETSLIYLKYSKKCATWAIKSFLIPITSGGLIKDDSMVNCQIEMGQPPENILGTNIEELLSNFGN